MAKLLILPVVISVILNLAVLMGCYTYFQLHMPKLAVIDIDNVLKDHVKHFGSIRLNEKERENLAKVFSHSIDSELVQFEKEGFFVLVKQAVIQGNAIDLTERLQGDIEATMIKALDDLKNAELENE